MKFENTCVMGFEGAMRGMRNPLASWNRGDSKDDKSGKFKVGPNDMELAQRLIRAGSEHRKFLRQIIVSVDITAPMYWWKEFDTYKVGTTANSTSTMHKLASNPIDIEYFEISDFESNIGFQDGTTLGAAVRLFLDRLEQLRTRYNATHDKKVWKEIVRWLPSGWMYKRTVTMSYENILAMCSKGQRRYHKLTEWSVDFISWARSLPYAKQFLFPDEAEKDDRLPRIICIAGHAGNGKDTVGAFMRDALDGPHKVLLTHYADLLKFMLREYFDWDGQKDERGRHLLQWFGTDVIRAKNPDYWVNFVINLLKITAGTWDYVIIPDCRFPNELTRFAEEGFDATLVRVTRPDYDSGMPAWQKAHASETSMDGVDADYEIQNTGTLDELREKSAEVAKKITNQSWTITIQSGDDSEAKLI